MARYLVTGAAGFIGSHLVERLLADGETVAGVDDFSTGKRENLPPPHPAFTFLEGDLGDPGVAARACAGAEVVLHEASIPSVPRSMERPLQSLHSTVTATVVLYEAARRAGVRRVVQAASSSVYGGRAPLPTDEDAPLAPLSPYAAAKASQEMYGRAYAAGPGPDVASLRYFNVFGPRQDETSAYAGVIAKFAAVMLGGRRPVIFGDGETSRDFTYVSDVVEANLMAARHPEPFGGRAFNVARGDRVSLNQLVAALNRLLGADLAPEYGPERAGDARHSQAATERARAFFGFVARVPFEEGLAATLAWYRARCKDRR